MKPITAKMLASLSTKEKASYMAPLAAAMNEFFPHFEITTELRIEHFLAQALHESDGFRTLQEYASGAAYEGRTDLGNTKKGYGVKYKGRGIFQNTGYANMVRLTTQFKKLAKLLGDPSLEIDLVKNPELLEQPRYAVVAACLYWQEKKLNALADKDDVRGITKRVNGGYNGLEDRVRYLAKCRAVIGRQDDTVATLRANGSETIKVADTLKIGSGAVMAGSAATPALEYFETTSDWFSRFSYALDPFKEYLGWLFNRPWLLLTIAGAVIFYLAWRLTKTRLDGHKAGNIA